MSSRGGRDRFSQCTIDYVQTAFRRNGYPCLKRRDNTFEINGQQQNGSRPAPTQTSTSTSPPTSW